MARGPLTLTMVALDMAVTVTAKGLLMPRPTMADMAMAAMAMARGPLMPRPTMVATDMAAMAMARGLLTLTMVAMDTAAMDTARGLLMPTTGATAMAVTAMASNFIHQENPAPERHISKSKFLQFTLDLSNPYLGLNQIQFSF